MFGIVGIGASAGGLEALEQFLKHVPANSGIGYVVVQHLDPTHKGIMVELLQRITEIPVIQVKDRTSVLPDHVYVIPPNKDMSIMHGVLHLLEPAAPRGLRLPIDYFFRSLADDQQERSVGVLLSGMGSDGTMGLRAIREKAGIAFVQSPSSAKFDGMPKSAIEAGMADVIASVEELPDKILTHIKYAPSIARHEQILESKTQSALEKIFIILRTQTGHDFSMYKKSTVYRRTERRMSLNQIDKISDYIKYLQTNAKETELLFKELLIGVTNFFRDSAEWKVLEDKALHALLPSPGFGRVLRAWIPGCSTGEEAYSLAILFKEALAKIIPEENIMLQIFATDLDKDAIDKARFGVYPANIAADVSREHLRRFFVKEEMGYRVCKEIRDMVVFAPQNVIMDPPFTKLDILICRNLLIYLVPELQKKLLSLFFYGLNPGGILFLGSAETVGTYSKYFTPINGKARIYKRLDVMLPAEAVEFPSSVFPILRGLRPETIPEKPAPNVQTMAEQLLLSSYTPSAVLTNDKGDIVFISGRTGKYLEPSVGKANLNIFAMAREGLRYEIDKAYQNALRRGETIILKGIKIRNNGGSQLVDVTVQPIHEPSLIKGMVIVVFNDISAVNGTKTSVRIMQKTAKGSNIEELEKELEQTRQELQTTREEMQTSHEELKTINEELQSTNEELQSTNEELTTSKEEMQSMNEELQTVNHELQSKLNELSQANNDMKNLLDSTDIATLFLDNDLNIRRFTMQATKIIKLIPGDVGRPITDIASDIIYPELTDDAQDVLRTLVFAQKPISTHYGRWFQVRIMPYRTIENRIDGVVITFTDITEYKKLENELRKAAERTDEKK